MDARSSSFDRPYSPLPLHIWTPVSVCPLKCSVSAATFTRFGLPNQVIATILSIESSSRVGVLVFPSSWPFWVVIFPQSHVCLSESRFMLPPLHTSEMKSRYALIDIILADILECHGWAKSTSDLLSLSLLGLCEHDRCHNPDWRVSWSRRSDQKKGPRHRWYLWFTGQTAKLFDCIQHPFRFSCREWRA